MAANPVSEAKLDLLPVLTATTDNCRVNGVRAHPRFETRALKARQVAEIVAGSSTIGSACGALRLAGWHASIAGNRITADDEVYAQFISVGVGDTYSASWMVYAPSVDPIWLTAHSDG